MQQIELTSKLVLAIIALTSVSAILVPTYAAPQIKSADIVNGEVKTEDLAPNAVTSPKIQDGQVNTGDLANNAVTTGKILDGAIQSQDIADGVIPSGNTQPTIHKVQGDTVTIPAGGHNNARAVCPAGESLTGGGFAAQPGFLNARVTTSAPETQDTWLASATNDDTSTIDLDLFAFALCLDPTP